MLRTIISCRKEQWTLGMKCWINAKTNRNIDSYLSLGLCMCFHDLSEESITLISSIWGTCDQVVKFLEDNKL
ncbi:uncharacterized protein DS421_19g655650 [Arachis hypogaea]|uniref:Uncharacterized protein n=1 Tax=Arachis hypogaea TaxID=3818 RepID=A0A6B9V8L1_ARAHY|nr:uncharacterized protein DS421_19g655650 [Arachis hypogaea]